ncbi:MAG: hypothetical protein FWF05_00055 [Oscillospiraceae bacterium]|nr:hypothetical protein [Oscillospiraceae bacterium]
MNTVKIDFNAVTGKIKPMHAVNNPPTVPCDTAGLYGKIKEANIPYARLHDTGGSFGGAHYVDVGNIFPNFSADESDPASYDFAFTDSLLAAMDGIGLKPFYRLGCTIENDHRIKAYHIYPPADPHKWARICRHIILHYNESWADGFHYGIQYWEIWNEPDNEPEPENNPMWRGTQREYFELYDITAKYLKDSFPGLKIGGYAGCGFSALSESDLPRPQYFMEFFHNFCGYISAHRSPLDFFSWHSYDGVKEIPVYAAYVREQLDRYGFKDAQSIFNEWNPGRQNRGKAADASNIAAVMCALQKAPVDMCMYYDGQVHSPYCGLFSADELRVFKAYYAFKAFGALYALENEARSAADGEDLYVCAATGADRREALVVNNSNEEKEVVFDVPNSILACYATDEEHEYACINIDQNEAVALPPYAVWHVWFS